MKVKARSGPKPGAKDCEKAGAYMMKYMDGEIKDKEALRLKEHVALCQACRRDFTVYDFIMGELAGGSAEEEAAEGFTEAVMAKISVLAVGKKAAMSAVDTILCTVFGVFSVVFGLGFLLVINREQITEYFSGVPSLEGYVRAITPVSEKVYEFFGNVISLTGDFLNACAGFLYDYRYVVSGVFAVLLVSQYLITRRSAIADRIKRK